MNATSRKGIGRTDRRLSAYATLAGVVLAAPAIETADAFIVWSGPVNITIPSSTAGIYLNVVTGVFNSNPAAAPGWDVNPWNITTLNFFTPTPNPGGGEMVGTGTTYFNVGPSFVIGPASTYANPGSTTINPGTPLIIFSDANYVGFRFINEAAGGQIQYGWLQISLSGSAGSQPRTIVSYAYENSGGFGVRAWRKRRNTEKNRNET